MPIFLSAYFILRTRQEMYVSRNNEVHLCNHCCSRRAINITYCKSVFVTLGMQHAMRMRHTVICDLSTLSHQWHNVGGGVGNFTEYKMCVYIFFATFV